jgi:hypothetical protein
VLPVFFIEPISFRLKKTDFGERQFNLPAVGGFLHRHVAPGGIGDDGPAGVGGDDFAAAGGGATEVGPQKGARILAAGFCPGAEREQDFIADEAQEAFAGGGSHQWLGQLHAVYLPSRRRGRKQKPGENKFNKRSSSGQNLRCYTMNTKMPPGFLWIALTAAAA